MHIGEEVEHSVVVHKDRLHRDLARRHDEGVPAAAFVGQRERLAVLVQHGQAFEGVALVGGHGDGHSVALGGGLGRNGHGAVLIDAGRDLGVGNGDASAAASTTAAAAGGTAAGGRVCDADADLLFSDHTGICVDCGADQGHRALLITEAEGISADHGVGIILFQRPAYRSRVGRQLFRREGRAELVERRDLDRRQVERGIFPDGRGDAVCGDRGQPSRRRDRQGDMVAFDVAGTGVDLGRVLLQRLERSVFERNHIRSGADPFKAAAGHLSAVLVEAGGGELLREDRVLIQPQDKAVLPVGADGLEDGLLLGLDNDILRRLSGRSRSRLKDDVRIGRLRDAAGRNEQFSVFNRGISLIGVCQFPLDVGRDRAGIAVLVAGEQRDTGQVIGRALDSRRSAAVVVQLVQIRLRRHLYGQRLRRFVNRLSVLVLSDRVIQGNGIRADDKAGERAAADFGIALVRGEPPLEQFFVKRHVLAVLILGLHNERTQVEGVRRIIIIDEIGDRAVHGQRLELPLGQYLERHAVGLGVVYDGVDLIISRLGKFDVARGLVDGQAVVVLHAPSDSAGHVEILALLVLRGHGQTRNVGGVAAVVEVERLKAAAYGDRG